MALTLVSYPDDFCSAYKPLSFGVTSTKHPDNTTAGESGIAINIIRVADATDVATYGAPLEEGDLFVYHTVVTLGVLPVGQTVKITGSNIVEYNGVWRVLKEVSDKVKVIDAEDFGAAIMGTMEKYYENYTLIAGVTVEASSTVKYYDVGPDSDGVFLIEPSGRLRNTFKDVFELADSESLTTAAIDAAEYITQTYRIQVEEAYNIPDSDGVNVYTLLGKSGSLLLIADRVAVNSIQPYHHVNETDQSVDLNWQDDLNDYILSDDGDTGKRWLTYRDHGPTFDHRKAQRQKYDDPVWLGFLYGGDAASTEGNAGYRIKYTYVTSAGSTSSSFLNITLDSESYIINVGAEALSLPSTIVRYAIAMYYGNTEVIPDTWFAIEEECFDTTRFYVLNRFGAIDSYTADGGKVTRDIDVKRRVIERSNMGRYIPVAGDYNRRTYATESTAFFTQSTRKESIEQARWILDELLSSPDVRIQRYNGNNLAYTPVIFSTNKASAGYGPARFTLQWSLGVDNMRQQR